jgi:hypothetical protein
LATWDEIPLDHGDNPRSADPNPRQPATVDKKQTKRQTRQRVVAVFRAANASTKAITYARVTARPANEGTHQLANTD